MGTGQLSSGLSDKLTCPHLIPLRVISRPHCNTPCTAFKSGGLETYNLQSKRSARPLSTAYAMRPYASPIWEAQPIPEQP